MSFEIKIINNKNKNALKKNLYAYIYGAWHK